jgi:hypothetical protein
MAYRVRKYPLIYRMGLLNFLFANYTLFTADYTYPILARLSSPKFAVVSSRDDNYSLLPGIERVRI